MNVDWVALERLSRYPTLLGDLARREPSLAPFFPTLAGATAAEALHRTARAVARTEVPRAAVAERLASENAALGASSECIDAARSLADPRTVAVVAGQQPGLFVGPLLSVYKVITAIRVAAEIERRGEFRAVPVFWCHTDDHDLDEANQLHVLTREFEVRRLRAAWESTGEPLHARRTDDALRALVAEARDAFPATPRRDEAFGFLEPHDNESLGEWCCRSMLRLFSGHRLVMLEPRWLRRESAELLGRAALLDPGVAESIRERGAALRRLGHAQGLGDVSPPFLFRLDEAGRRKRVAPTSGARLAADIHRSPELFSPDVALRPVAQSALLPCAAIVVGPSEAAYVAQLGGLFDALHVPIPYVAPRLTATLLEDRVDAARRAFGIGYEELLKIGAEMPESGGMPPDVRASFDSVRSTLEREMARIKETLRSVSDSAAAGFENALGALQERLRLIERRAEDAFREGSGRGRAQWRRLYSSVLPRDLPQERVFGPLPFVVRYRTSWIEEILGSPDLPAFPAAHAFVHVAQPQSDPRMETST
ncbi:MAG: bacillithiol biosynthesis BshC [Planctomycetes bacterium]|nr:bacillithiol biosynthesis BshC [Planctomycetota bacterium]MBI3848266.1 bacillithiol biosynthesis BshC [Planctomycetota bacterium]